VLKVKGPAPQGRGLLFEQENHEWREYCFTSCFLHLSGRAFLEFPP
jgi:hypothetical protein